MDMRKTAKEIGLLETAVNLSKVRDSDDVIYKIGTSMPMPDNDIEAEISQAAKWLLDFGKEKYMFLTPEIAMIEEMGKQAKRNTEAIIAVPCDLEAEAKERLYNNLPQNICVTILEEPYFPQSFFPGNGMMVMCGYLGGGRAMILPETYRLVEHYSGFLGKKVFVPYKELDTAARYDGWLEVSQQRLSTIWRRNYE